MKFFTPDLALGVLLPAQGGLEDKLGGIPWGLPRSSWPRCRSCKAPQVLLAQLVHHAERLDLGAVGRVVFVFQCADQERCATADGASGANAVVVVDAADLEHGPTRLPHPEMEVVTEARVLKWKEHEVEDGETNDEGTAVGGAPCWLQRDDTPEGRGWRFLFQIQFYWSFPGPVPAADALGCDVRPALLRKPVKESSKKKKQGAPRSVFVHDDGAWTVTTSIWGDSMGYVFLREHERQSEGWVLWQAT
jgi:hypothetical protein